MEMMCIHKMKKKRLAPLFVLTILLLTSSEMMTTASGELVCDVRMPMCVGVCYKSGKCMRCCKRIGFHHGRCSLIHGMGCYCCEEHDAATAAARRNVTAAAAASPSSSSLSSVEDPAM